MDARSEPALRPVRGRLSPGLSDPLHQPPRPGIWIVSSCSSPRRRTKRSWRGRTRDGTDVGDRHEGVTTAMSVFARIVQQQRPDLPDAYFRIARAGWLRMGIGSATAKKVLIRVDGPSLRSRRRRAAGAKAIRALADVRCLETPRSGPTFRVITGNQQLGRLKHDILVAGPEVPIPELSAEGPNLATGGSAAGNPLSRDRPGRLRVGRGARRDCLRLRRATRGRQRSSSRGSGGRRPAAAVAGLARQVEGRLRGRPSTSWSRCCEAGISWRRLRASRARSSRGTPGPGRRRNPSSAGWTCSPSGPRPSCS